MAKKEQLNEIVEGIAKATKQRKRANTPVGSDSKNEKWTTLNMQYRLDEVKGYAAQGYSEQRIADTIGVSLNVLKKWKEGHEEFAATLSDGKEATRAKIFNASVLSSTGYFVTENAYIKCKIPYEDKHGDIVYTEKGQPIYTEKVCEVEVKKYITPNAQIQIFLLCNLSDGEYSRVDREGIADENAADALSRAIARSRELAGNEIEVTTVDGKKVTIIDTADGPPSI